MRTHGLFSLVLIFILAGTAHAKPLDVITSDDQAVRLKELEQLVWSGKANEQSEGTKNGCRKSRITFEITDPLTSVTKPQIVTILRPDVEARVPVMIIVPTIQGEGVVENATAGQFCDMGLASIVADVNDPTFPKDLPAWGVEDSNNRFAVIALRTVIDYASVHPSFDANKIGLMGFSLGGITAAMMAGVENERLQAVITVVGGGNMPFILSTSDESRVSKFRNERMQAAGIKTADEYEDLLRSSVHYDPMYFASRAQTAKIFMVRSKSDTKVPTLVQNDLYAAFGQPKDTVFSVGHVQTIIGITYFYFDLVADFVRERFDLKANLQPRSLVNARREELRREIPEALKQLAPLE